MMSRQKVSCLTEEGIEKAEEAFGIDNLFDLKHVRLTMQSINRLKHMLVCI